MPAGSLSVLITIVTAGPATSAPAQPITFNSRNGQNTAYCGPSGGIVGVQHDFSTVDPTHDPISVSEGGGASWGPSEAASQLDATPSSTGIVLGATGSGSRGPLIGFGVYAVAALRDGWVFTLSEPACFTFSVSLSAGSTGGETAQGYGFIVRGGGAQIIPDPGTPPDAFGGGLVGAGSFTRSASGTLLAGQYEIYMHGRADGHNSYPWSGSYENSLALSLNDCSTPGDCDDDGDVDLDDYATFESCLSGPADPPPSDCDCSDFDGGGHADLADFAEFQVVFTE